MASIEKFLTPRLKMIADLVPVSDTVCDIGTDHGYIAIYLAKKGIAKKVIVVHRRDTLRATKVHHDSLLNAPNIEFFWNSAITELLQNGKLSGVRIQNLLTGEQKEISCDGLFVSIGRAPATKLVEGLLELDESGYIVAGESTETSIPGVYAVGDIRTKALRQIVTAVADGAMAAMAACRYLD